MPLAEAKRIDIGVEGSRDAWVKANEIDLLTLVKNLVDNAIRYTPEGGRVDLSVSTTPDREVALRVCDDGPGIPNEERARVFDPFYRSMGSTQVGSGLTQVCQYLSHFPTSPAANPHGCWVLFRR